MPPESKTTELLLRLRHGDRAAFDRLYAHLYDELRAIAHLRLERFRPSETLGTSVLLHEAYIRLVDQSRVDVQDRSHFMALAARAMRFIVVDYARERSAKKRGGEAHRVEFDQVQIGAESKVEEVLIVHDALERLEASSERLARIVEYRFFGGLTYEEISEVTGRSVPTVKRDWKRARTWLYRVMQAGP